MIIRLILIVVGYSVCSYGHWLFGLFLWSLVIRFILMVVDYSAYSYDHRLLIPLFINNSIPSSFNFHHPFHRCIDHLPFRWIIIYCLHFSVIQFVNWKDDYGSVQMGQFNNLNYKWLKNYSNGFFDLKYFFRFKLQVQWNLIQFIMFHLCNSVGEEKSFFCFWWVNFFLSELSDLKKVEQNKQICF